MGMLSLLYKLRSSTALATPPRPRPRPGPRLVWIAPSVLGEHALAPAPEPMPAPEPALAPAPFEVDGVTLVYCQTYAEAAASIREMVADAEGKPVALDLETCPVQFERERLAALLEERKTVNAEAIAFRKAAKKAGTPRPEIDAYTEAADAQLKILDARIDYAESAGLDPNRSEIRTLQVYGGKARAAIIDIAKTGAEALGLLQGVSGGHSWLDLRSRFPRAPWRQSWEGSRHPTSGAIDDRREQVLARRGGQTLPQGRPR